MSAFVNIFIDHDKNKIVCESVLEDATDRENAYAKKILSYLSLLVLEDHDQPAIFDLGTKISIIEVDNYIEVDIIDNGKKEIIGGKTVLSHVLAVSVLEELHEKYSDSCEEDFDYE